jgi:hypothetical protein
MASIHFIKWQAQAERLQDRSRQLGGFVEKADTCRKNNIPLMAVNGRGEILLRGVSEHWQFGRDGCGSLSPPN